MTTDFMDMCLNFGYHDENWNRRMSLKVQEGNTSSIVNGTVQGKVTLDSDEKSIVLRRADRPANKRQSLL